MIPFINYDFPVRENSEVVIIYPDSCMGPDPIEILQFQRLKWYRLRLLGLLELWI